MLKSLMNLLKSEVDLNIAMDLSSPEKVENPPATPFAYKIEDKRATWSPRFGRTYSTRLDNRCRIEVTANNRFYGGGRDYSGILIQPNGNSIYFDPDRIADKIIDPLLTPLVEKACAEIKVLDRVYARNLPDFFVDDQGQKWVRA